MNLDTGKFLSDGNKKTVSISFKPDLIFAISEAGVHPCFFHKYAWCARTNCLGQDDSFINGIQIDGNDIIFGLAPEINSSGYKTYWVAIGRDGSNDYDITDYLGNGTNPRTIDLGIAKQILFALIKRDSTRTGVIKISSYNTIYIDGITTPTEAITSLGVGSVDITAAVQVNEYNSTSGLGEGINLIAVNTDSQNCEVVSWAGGQSEGTVISTTLNPAFSIILVSDSTTPARLLTIDMDSYKTKSCSASIFNSNEALLTPSGIKLGSASGLNTSGKTYYAIVFGLRNNHNNIPSIIVSGDTIISLTGNSSYIDCGNSDDTLKIDGAITIEWWGSQMYHGSIYDSPLIMRGNGPYGRANPGSYSWGITADDTESASLSWGGPQAVICVANFLEFTHPLDTCSWRSGIIIPNNKPMHIVVTHDGNGKWRFFLDGRLVKQRNYSVTPNIQSGVGHYTIIGARYASGSVASVTSSKIYFEGASVWSRELTILEAETLFNVRRHNAINDVSDTSLCERWLSVNASGSTISAVVNANNNGTIVNGSITTY